MPRPGHRPPASQVNIVTRDVSPLGASRFEGPFSPTSISHSKQSSASTTPSRETASPPPDVSSTRSSHRNARSDSLVTAYTSFSSPTTSLPSSRGSDTTDTCESGTCTTPIPFATWIDGPRAKLDPCAPFLDSDGWSALDAGCAIGGVESDPCPDGATLAAARELTVYDATGTARPFASLYDPARGAPHARTLLVFVRHFFCGACQAYLRALAAAIPARDYFAIPAPTGIVVVGCGQPHLIPHYRAFTGCPFPVFADPDRRVFRRLGMPVSFRPLGPRRPDYMRDTSVRQWLRGQVVTVTESLKDPEGIAIRDVWKGGHPMQIGGEFLVENGHVVWCHRMRNYRGHAEVQEVRKVLGLDE